MNACKTLTLAKLSVFHSLHKPPKSGYDQLARFLCDRLSPKLRELIRVQHLHDAMTV